MAGIQTSLDNLIIRITNKIDKSRFGVKDKIFFCREIAYLLQGGVSPIQALVVIAEGADNFAVKDMSLQILAYIKQGKTFSYALSRLSDYFTETDYNIIKIGEKSGQLPDIFQAMAKEYSFMLETKNKYISALVYPILLLVIAIIAVLSLFLLVLPNIFSIADQFNVQDLPRMTAVLKNISDFMMVQWRILLGGGVVLISILSIYMTTDHGRRTSFYMLTAIPLIGKMVKHYYLIKRCRYMHLMMTAHMNYVQMFQLLASILHVGPYQDMLLDVLARLQRGGTIYDQLKQHQHLVPLNVSTLIHVGEQTAQLDQSVKNILTMYEQELNTMIDRIAKVIEPIMLIIIGAIVVIIALGVFGLILHIMEGVGI